MRALAAARKLEDFISGVTAQRTEPHHEVLFLSPHAVQDIDPDYLKTNKSSWINLPNSYYDRKGAKLYHRYLDELELADTLSFDGVCVNEHHQTAYGMMPSPNVLAGALSDVVAVV